MIGEVGAGALISYFPSIWKNLQIASSDIRVALALPSAEYPAMCGVPIITFSNNSRLISGSCSHTSIIASEIEPLFNAFKRVPVSITSPREVLMITGLRFSELKKSSSARWNVLYLPSLYKGT